MNEWYAFESGASIGRRGPEGGRVVLDMELGDPEDPEDADARLTLETDGESVARVIANLYGGWLYLVAERKSEADARTAFDELKPELERLSDLIPVEGDRDIDARVGTLMKEVALVEARFGSQV
jgi:hypothetical protein